MKILQLTLLIGLLQLSAVSQIVKTEIKSDDFPGVRITITRDSLFVPKKPKSDSIPIYLSFSSYTFYPFLVNTDLLKYYSSVTPVNQGYTLFKFYLHPGNYKSIFFSSNYAVENRKLKLLFKEFSINEDMAHDTLHFNYNNAKHVIKFDGTYVDGEKYSETNLTTMKIVAFYWLVDDLVSYGFVDQSYGNFPVYANKSFASFRFSELYFDTTNYNTAFYQYPKMWFTNNNADTTWLINSANDFAKQTFNINGLPIIGYDFNLMPAQIDSEVSSSIYGIVYCPIGQYQPGMATFNYYHNAYVDSVNFSYPNFLYYNDFSWCPFRGWEDGKMSFAHLFKPYSSNLDHQWDNGDTVNIDNGPVNIWVNTRNTDSTVRFYDIYSCFHSWLAHPDWEKVYNIELADANSQTIAKTITGWDAQQPLAVTPGEYTFFIKDDDYYIGGNRGLVTVESTFDLTKGDKQPPKIHNIQVRNSSGVPWHRLKVGEQCTLVFSAADLKNMKDYQPLNPQTTKAWAKTHGTDNWVALSLNYIEELERFDVGSLYSADLTPFTQEAAKAFDLKFYCQDSVGNHTTYILSPAGCTKGYEIPFLIPVAITDSIKLYKGDASKTANLLNNDLGEPPFALTMDVVVGPTNDTLDWEAGGKVVYTPNQGFAGTDLCRYIAYNGNYQSQLAYAYFVVDTLTTIWPQNNRHGVCLYPNPGSGLVAIKGISGWQNTKIVFYGIAGKAILTCGLNGKGRVVNTADMPKGLYIYKITANGKKTVYGKWIKR